MRFGQVATVLFTMRVDLANAYTGIVQYYGVAPPAVLSIPYNLMFSKFARFAIILLFQFKPIKF